MLRIAARYADQWDSFAAMPGTATDGVETELADRIARLDAACREVGRDPRRDPPIDLDDERRAALSRRLSSLRRPSSAPRFHRLLDRPAELPATSRSFALSRPRSSRSSGQRCLKATARGRRSDPEPLTGGSVGGPSARGSRKPWTATREVAGPARIRAGRALRWGSGAALRRGSGPARRRGSGPRRDGPS